MPSWTLPPGHSGSCLISLSLGPSESHLLCDCPEDSVDGQKADRGEAQEGTHSRQPRTLGAEAPSPRGQLPPATPPGLADGRW